MAPTQNQGWIATASLALERSSEFQNKTAAAEVGISSDQVNFHLRSIYEKLHVHSRTEAVARAMREGLIR